MKVIGVIATILVSMGMALILACSEEKTASIEGHEDIVAVLQKIPQCFENPSTAHEIYAEDAIIKFKSRSSVGIRKYTGLKEIENMFKETGKSWRVIDLSIDSIEKEADIAHVKYRYKSQSLIADVEVWKRSCSAEMVKKGEMWKIKEVKSKPK
ncbi:MAG: hypothetical protein JSV50_11760 [Desulfobacteraceae bacterium]|nr:MAG: hypothetical protein JSV50_11760 [Desulfobacteraceae bacterium]